jgi:16S rRNA (cytosine1402-N4)-methyltransferase
LKDLHVPVLLEEVVEAFSIFKERNDLVYFDGTFGRGGHFSAIQEKYNPQTNFITDQDLTAIQVAEKNWNHLIQQQKLILHHKNFIEFVETCPKDIKFDMVLLDLGVSSPQLDDAARGFSFNKDGPLDMRMNQSQKLSAEQIINENDEDDLMNIFKTYGEVQNPYRVVKAIIQDRIESPFKTTLSLANLIERVDGWKKKGFHPATQYFMALWVVVNRELQVIENVLPKLIQQMQDQGRIAVITFHSLEDRIVKNIFKESLEGFLVNKKVIVPSENECRMNTRARSAKLRIFQKGHAPEKPDKFALRRAQRIG